MVVQQGEERQRAIEEIVSGPALGRSEQLRQLLRYLASEEAAGRGHELTEYSIGVHALGRPADYSPEVDSTVRTRVHELRKRLEEHYRQFPESDWRLELPKGSYRVRLARRDAAPKAEASPAVAETAAPGARKTVGTSFWIGGMAGAGVLAVCWMLAQLWMPAGEQAAREIWGPMLRKGGTITMVLATPPQLWVREFGDQPPPVGDPPQTFPVPADQAFVNWYERMTLHKAQGLLLHPNNHSPLGGEANAAITLAGFAAARQARVELLAGDYTGAAEIRDRNAVVLGRPEYCNAAQALQPSSGWTVRYVPERREVGVVPVKGGQPSFFRERSGTINYGLVTVLTKPTDSGPKRTILFAGINSDGSEAAMSFLTSLLHLEELVQELRHEKGRVPGSYQVVIRSRSSNTRSLQAERVAIQVLDGQ